MEQISGGEHYAKGMRRWPRHRVDLSVRIIALNGILTTPIPARGSEISRAGMALRAPVALEPGDRLRLQFPTSTPSRVTAVVRSRTGACLGLEFLTQLPPDSEAKDRSTPGGPALDGSPNLRRSPANSFSQHSLYAGLYRKQEELRQLQKEIEALNMAIPLLVDEETELSRSSASRRLRPELGQCDQQI